MENPEYEYKQDQSLGHREFWRRILAEVRAESEHAFTFQGESGKTWATTEPNGHGQVIPVQSNQEAQ